MPSTRWRSPATASATTSRAPSPMLPTPNYWPIWCVPIDTTTALSPVTPPMPRRSKCWPALRVEQLAAPAAVTAAFATSTRAMVGIIAELNRQITALETELATHFETHPDADIYRSLPGLGVILGARVLGEFGDDPNRYT